MFSYLSQFLYRFGSKPVQMALLAALAAVVAAVLLGSFVRWLRRRRQDRPESWTGLLVAAVGDVLKVLIGLGVLAGICLHMRLQSEEFARQRGGTSERAYEAVKTIWGRPHVQRELSSRLVYYTTHYYDKDGLELDPDRLKAASQPVSFRKQEVEHAVPGEAILQADHEIALWMNYRRKGSAYYPTFETDCAYRYRVANVSDRKLTAIFRFPLPEEQGLIDKLDVRLDGKSIGRSFLVEDEALGWKMDMAAGQEQDVAISYHSRGMDHLRLEPGAGRQLRRYRVQLLCREIAPEQINYPVGCMTPTDVTADENGTHLSWDLDQAVTRLGMGVIVPKKTQEGYYVARVLSAGPWGLVLLLAMVIITHAAAGRPVSWVMLALLAGAYYLYFLLAAQIGEYEPGLAGGMFFSGLAATAMVVALFARSGDRFSGWATVAFFVLLAFAYPLLRISEHEGLLLTILYVALLGYVVALVVRRRAGRTEGAE